MEPDHKHIAGLPLSVVGPVDLGRLIRELDNLDNALHSMKVRETGQTESQEIRMPKTSILLDQTAQLNKLNLLLDEDRKTLKDFLATVRKRAPRLHVSFSADPSPLFVEKLMAWLRAQIHPVVLMTIGLQPNIGAGCVVRTTNKYFDLSLSKDFDKHRDLLMSKLRESVTVPQRRAQDAAEAADAAQDSADAAVPAATEGVAA